jgi:hypothetical protein
MRADEQKPDTRRERRTSRLLAAKSIAIKGAKRTSGGGASKAVELTLGGLRRVPSGLRGSQGLLTAAQKSAEAIVGQKKLCRPEGRTEKTLTGRRAERSPQGEKWQGE